MLVIAEISGPNVAHEFDEWSGSLLQLRLDVRLQTELLFTLRVVLPKEDRLGTLIHLTINECDETDAVEGSVGRCLSGQVA